MKSILLSEGEHHLRAVYSPTVVEQLKKCAQLDPTFYTKADLLASPERFADTEYIFSTWGMPAWNEQEIRTVLPRLKAVFYAAGSVQSFARPFLSCGVRVFSAWAANAVPVAEYTVAQIVLANKGFFSSARLASAGRRAEAVDVFSQHVGNYGAKVGIIGAGMIGRRVIELLRAYRLEVVVFDPFLSDGTAAALGVEKVTLERLFAECHVVSNHLADNPQTRGMLTGALFASMQPYATFINTGRGAQVVESELCEVLRQRPDLCALLDVTHPEPPRPDSAFYGLDNCLLTPHIAGSAGQEVWRMAEYMAEEYESLATGKACRFEVTPPMLETMA